MNIYSRVPCQHQHALVEYIFNHRHAAAVNSEECDQLHIQHKSRFCTPFVRSQCTACACRVTSISDFFFVLAGCQHAKQKDVLLARFFFTNVLLNCHDALRHKHTKVIHCCTRIPQTQECRSPQSSFPESTPPGPPLRHFSRPRRHDPLAPIDFPPEIRSNRQQAMGFLTRLIGRRGDYPMRPTPHLLFL